MVPGVERFGIDALLRHRCPAPAEQWPQRSAAQAVWPRCADEVENGRCQVDVLHRLGHATPSSKVPRQLDDERHQDRFVVQKDAVLLLTVISKPLTVIREQDDGRVIIHAMGSQRLQQPANDLIRVGDLPIIGSVLGVPRRCGVRLVWFVEMQEQEQAGRALQVKPTFRGG